MVYIFISAELTPEMLFHEESGVRLGRLDPILHDIHE